MSFRVACEFCNSKINVSNDKYIGKKVPCPKCKKPLLIQPPSDEVQEVEILDVSAEVQATPSSAADPFLGLPPVPAAASALPADPLGVPDPFGSAAPDPTDPLSADPFAGTLPTPHTQSNGMPPNTTTAAMPSSAKSGSKLPLVLGLVAGVSFLLVGAASIGAWFLIGGKSNDLAVSNAVAAIESSLPKDDWDWTGPNYFGYTRKHELALLEMVNEVTERGNFPDEQIKNVVTGVLEFKRDLKMVCEELGIPPDENGNFVVPAESHLGKTAVEIQEAVKGENFENPLDKFGIMLNQVALLLKSNHDQGRNSAILDECLFIAVLLSAAEGMA